MGWTEYQATHFYNSGTINRKAECDGYFLESLNRGHYDVVKSTMKGSVYYGAIKLLKRPVKNELGQCVVNANGRYEYENIPENETEVFGVVILTYVDRDQFGYKLISESCGPSYYDCPKHILDALTPTNDALAKEWRDRCYANASKPSIAKLPIGSEIQFMLNGQEFTLRKSAPRYQFKTPFWINDANCTYFSKKRIPRDFKIITLPTK